MSNKGIVFISLATTLLFNLSAFSQEKELGTEVVNIVKPYTPTISDAFKVKETPSLNDSTTTQKKEVEYSIFSVPVASTFSPAKGKATDVEKTKREKVYDNYATLGAGNYGTLLGELYSNFEISRTDNVGFFFRHNSSQGQIKGVELDNKYFNTTLDANYTSRQREATYQLEAGIEHQIYNWYGTATEFFPVEYLGEIDPKQTYFGGYVGGSIALEKSVFERAGINIRYLGDAYSSSEFNVKLKPEFSFSIENLTLKVDGDIDYLKGSFENDYYKISDINYSYLNLGVIPSLVYMDEDITLSLGVAGYLGMDAENSETDFSLYPKVNASYRLMDETVIVYAGAEGGLQQNSYYSFKEKNPFVSPTLDIVPTKNIYDGFAGVKGKLTNNVAYNFRAAYRKDENRALFLSNERKVINMDSKGYENWNSFKVVYDDVNTLEIFAELQTEISNMFSLGVNLNYFNYKTDTENQAWNLPNIKTSVFSNFIITEQLYGGASIFYVSERKDLVHSTAGGPGTSLAQEVTLDGYVDANVHFGYRFTDRLSAFIKGNNLFGDNYEKWLDYPVQGIQALVGATYKFDW
ncbi:TonB-dependent receptor [Aequorivita sp. H23M31]|uniref:TonB-dependent receptor n=1 Tax=Aequorivita ciconiae TaxID=2494375 RepID=A0A410G6Q8_9FLAO|nr:TonB-dependent receptor [Aequorivita sp. H23M31]QAA82920.1 TonB-dependent receptor [Aequorivita sp. H23M31]